jgi:hypothetical protein
MAVPTPRVEIGFDIIGANAPFFTLDDAVKGILDNAIYPLGGQIFYDVTDKVRGITTRRGKNRQLDEFDAGLANVVFENNDRTFDPTYEASPYFGQIIPKRAIRISSAGNRLFTGVIDDWNLNYEPGGFSEASAAASDAFTLFNTQTLPAGTATAQLSGARVNAILSLPDVNWPDQDRDIDAGITQLGADVFAEDTNVLSYLRTVSNSEPGNLFIDKLGRVTFTDRNPNSGDKVIGFADDNTGISYQGMKVVYGSELLYNEIVLGSQFAGTVTASDPTSIDEYGVLNLTQIDLLVASPTVLEQLAAYYAIKYSQPEYRFESIDVVVDDLGETEQQEVLALEIGDFVTVKFTPNGVPPAIRKVAEIIRIDHDITPEAHIVSLGFSTTEGAFWTLSDIIFGRLSTGNVLGF